MLTIEEPETFYKRKEDFPMREETYKMVGLSMEVHTALGKGFFRDSV